MKNELALLIESIQSAADRSELRQNLVPLAKDFFGAARGGIFFLNELPPPFANLETPMFKALHERHTPLHEGSVFPPGQWQATCSRADHGHVLLGPLVQNGEVIGALAFTRHLEDQEFDAQNLADLSALCLHVSTRLPQIEAPSCPNEAPPFRLTPRETEIAALVSQGLTNGQIAERLCVSSETIKAALKRMFRKTGVNSRAQLAALSSSTNSRSSPNNRASAGG